ncbi:MAG: ABC-2 transporter permease [Longimicrobiales bacterium]
MTGETRSAVAIPASGSTSTVKVVLRLLRMEWAVFHLWGRIAVFGCFVLAALQVVYVDELYLLLGVLLAATLAVYVPVVEWFQETDPMLHSLPIDRDAVVLARYLVAALAGTVAGIIWNAAGRILMPLLRAGGEDPAMWMTMEGGLTFVLAVGLMAILFLPLYFRMGMGRGAVAFLGLSLGLFFLAYGTSGLAWGPASGLAGSEALAGGFPLVPPSALIRSRVSALLGNMGLAGTLSLILVLLAAAFYASIRLSQRWYRRREF